MRLIAMLEPKIAVLCARYAQSWMADKNHYVE